MTIQNVLVVGATGHIGRSFVPALRARNKNAYLLIRPETVKSTDSAKRRLLDSFEHAGARIIEGSIGDNASLERACVNMDAVISLVNGPELAGQVALVNAAKKTATVQRFVPSEFGLDPHLAGEGAVALVDWKLALHEAFNRSGIPVTYVYSNGFATYWAAGLGQLGAIQPPRERITVYGDGNVKAALITTEDVARFTVRMLDDPETENKEVAILPEENLCSQNDLIATWEKKANVKLQRDTISAEQMDAIIRDLSAQSDRMLDMVYMQLARSVWIQGAAGKKRPEVLDASRLYPDIDCTRMTQFLDQFPR